MIFKVVFFAYILSFLSLPKDHAIQWVCVIITYVLRTPCGTTVPYVMRFDLFHGGIHLTKYN